MSERRRRSFAGGSSGHCLALAAFLLLFACPTFVTGSIPFIGGIPDLTSEATFSAGSDSGAWQGDVWSYAFIGSDGDDPVPPTMSDPMSGQTLFMYVIRMSDAPLLHPASANEFSVGNPIPVPVPSVGFDPTTIPEDGEGPFTGDRQNPSGVLSSLDARSVSYFFDGDNTLESGEPQGEFSVLFFLANEQPGWVNGTMTGGAATFDEHLVLGPIPEPSVGVLLVFGVAILSRRSRRRMR